jgi:hypothetical protein
MSRKSQLTFQFLSQIFFFLIFFVGNRPPFENCAKSLIWHFFKQKERNIKFVIFLFVHFDDTLRLKREEIKHINVVRKTENQITYFLFKQRVTKDIFNFGFASKHLKFKGLREAVLFILDSKFFTSRNLSRGDVRLKFFWRFEGNLVRLELPYLS